MLNFTIEGFAQEYKKRIDSSSDPHQTAKELLEETLKENDPEEMIATLQAAIPEGASIGEMIVHTSPILTMLYGRVPPKFQSGIHNHTLFACIGQLRGEEINYFYRPAPEGEGLIAGKIMVAKTGQVITLAADAIHSIENPNNETGHALHIYGGDFGAVMGERSLWSSTDHQQKPFSFPELMKESAVAMKVNNNQQGLDEMVKAIPSTQAIVDKL